MDNPKNQVIKASFANCSLEERAQFSQANAMILISVGQPYHEAEKLASTIALINKNFKSCTFLVADTLQRHNLCMQHDAEKEASYTKSLQLGDEWLSRNKSIFNRITIPCEFVRWDTFLKHKEYPVARKYIEDVFNKNTTFWGAVVDSAEEYVNRHLKRLNSAASKERMQYNCIQYLLEECAVMYMWRHENYQYEVYPNKRNSAMQAVFNMLIKPQHPRLLISVNLRFKRELKKAVAALIPTLRIKKDTLISPYHLSTSKYPLLEHR